MLSLLIYLLILVIVGGLLFYLIGLMPLPAPWGNVARVLIVVIFIVILLYLLLGGVDGGITVHERGGVRVN